MDKKKILGMALLVLAPIASFAASVSWTEGGASGVSYTVSTNKDVYLPGEAVLFSSYIHANFASNVMSWDILTASLNSTASWIKSMPNQWGGETYTTSLSNPECIVNPVTWSCNAGTFPSPSTSGTYNFFLGGALSKFEGPYGDYANYAGAGAILPITVQAPLPDLTAGGVTPIVATAGTAVTFSATISNSGAAGTGAGFSNLFEIDNTNNPALFSDINAVVAVTSPALGDPGSNTVSASYTFASAGTWYVRACADANTSNAGSIVESSEGNNCGAWATVVANQPPVAIITTPTAATSTTSGVGVSFSGSGTGVTLPGSSVPATSIYSCPAGYTLSGTSCQGPGIAASATYTQVCGKLVKGNILVCTAPNAVISNSTSCPAGGYAVCAGTQTTTYSCSAGYSLSGSTCYPPPISATVSYACSAGYTLSGTNCILVSTITAYEWRLNTCDTGVILNTNAIFGFSTTTISSHNIFLRVLDSLGTWSVNCPSRVITVSAPTSCPNGANNPSSCTQCPDGQAYAGSSCAFCTGGCSGAGNTSGTGATCNNLALNPPYCALCPGGQDLSSGVCANTVVVLPSCDNDGRCDAGETITNCYNDCKIKTKFWSF